MTQVRPLRTKKTSHKSAGNAPWLDPSQTAPYDYYQYWRNTEDADVARFMRMFTFMPLEEIAEYEQLSGADLNRAEPVVSAGEKLRLGLIGGSVA